MFNATISKKRSLKGEKMEILGAIIAFLLNPYRKPRTIELREARSE